MTAAACALSGCRRFAAEHRLGLVQACARSPRCTSRDGAGSDVIVCMLVERGLDALLCEVRASTAASSDPPPAIQGTLHGRHGRSGLHLFWYVCHQGAVASPLPYTSMCRHAMCICIGWLGLGTCVCSIACAYGPRGGCCLAIIVRHAILVALSVMLQAHGARRRARRRAGGGHARPRDRKPRREKISRAARPLSLCLVCVRLCYLSSKYKS